MKYLASGNIAAHAIALLGLLVSGCGSMEAPSFMKSDTAEKDKPDRSIVDKLFGRNGDDGGEIQTKQITKLSPLASVMLEKNCPNIVQPYRLTDNAASLGEFAGKKGLEEVSRLFGNVMRSGNAAPPQTAEMLASSKLAAKQLNWLPMNVEKLYGERAHREETNLLGRESRLGKKYYPIADGMLKDVQAKVGAPHNYDFQLFIQKTSTHNALSRPGGYLYVDQGLLEDPAEHPKAYFAIAHEVAHVLQRHETRELQSMIIDSISYKDELTKVISSAGANPDAVLARVKVGKNVFIRHHIDQELQADSCAARLLSRVFTERQELAGSLNAFLKELPKPEPVKSAPPASNAMEKLAVTMHDVVESPIKVHPNSVERTQNLQAIYAEISKIAVSTNR